MPGLIMEESSSASEPLPSEQPVPELTAEPCVTWLLPVHNALPYLPETLASIAAQTYRNQKVLARDDGSTDGTLEELRRWIPARIPGQVFMGSHSGIGPSLAFLVNQADTELCARIDGDDINLPIRLERQTEFMLKHPAVGLLGSQIRFIDETGRQSEGWRYALDDATLRWRSRWDCQFCHPSVLFRRSAVLAAGNYRNCKSEDTDLWLRMSYHTQFRNLSEHLIHYRRRADSLTGGTFNFRAMHRIAAQENALILFPTVRNAVEALDLWDATYPEGENAPSKFHHIRILRKAAVALASLVGEPRDYFTETESFLRQQDSLKMRFYERLHVAGLVRLRRKFGAAG